METIRQAVASPRADFLPLEGTDHIEFFVGNAKQAAHFYHSVLGFQPLAYAGHWIGYPGLEKEMSIVKKRLPGIENELLESVVRQVQQFRQQKLSKIPGISETIDWAESLVALGHRSLNQKAVEETLGAILKSSEDIALARQQMTEPVPSTS